MSALALLSSVATADDPNTRIQELARSIAPTIAEIVPNITAEEAGRAAIEFVLNLLETSVRVAKAPRKLTTEETTTLETIAFEHMGIPTLKGRNSDDKDFHDVAVWGVSGALEAAFRAGAAS